MKKLLRVLLQLPFLFVLVSCAAAAPSVGAYLYNPGADRIVIDYPYRRPADVSPLKASLNLVGSGFLDEDGQLNYSIEEKGKSVFTGSLTVKIVNGHFNVQQELPSK